MTDKQLEPCPFCGDNATVEKNGRGDFYALCLNCGARGPAKENQQDAGPAWDKRVPAPVSAPVYHTHQHFHPPAGSRLVAEGAVVVIWPDGAPSPEEIANRVEGGSHS